MELDDNLKKLLDGRLENFEKSNEKLIGWDKLQNELLNQISKIR